MTTPYPDNPHLTPPSCEPFRDDLEAYALGALDDVERFRLETHLDECAACGDALANIRRVTDYLPFLSPPASPPSGARASLMERITADIERDEPRAYPNPWTALQQDEQPNAAGSDLSRWQRWIAPALVAPLAIALIVVGAWANSLQNEVDDLRAGGQVPRIVNQGTGLNADIQLYNFEPACPECEDQQATGQLGGHPNSNLGVVSVRNLDPNAKHQVWCVNKQGEKLLVSDLHVEHSGDVFQAIAFPQELGGYQMIYVARNDGTPDPDAELLVAMTDEHEVDDDGTPASG